jgi:glycosyltransferase involved in cell wall biosynthesis
LTSIAFAWPGLPDYAARCIRAVIDRSGTAVEVIATRPSVPIEGMEKSLGQAVHWIDGAGSGVSWQALGVTRPRILFIGGYGIPAFNALADDVRRAGGHVVLMSDNNWTGTPRQKLLDPIRHRLLLRHRHDAIFVPGESGVRVARSWTYPQNAIQTGLYGADPQLFNGGPPLTQRPKRFLFVGQFVARKNVLGLAQAFIKFAAAHPDWSLSLCGSPAIRSLASTDLSNRRSSPACCVTFAVWSCPRLRNIGAWWCTRPH